MNNIGIYRSRRHSIFAGVIGGLAERYNWNVTLARIVFVIISISSAAFPGIIVYLVLWLLMPKQPVSHGSPPNDPRLVN